MLKNELFLQHVTLFILAILFLNQILIKIMKHFYYRMVGIFASFFFVFSCIFAQAQHPKKEFRGVWVATVNNIDWPSKPGLSSDEQKQEVIRILDKHRQNGMNAIVFQVRPCADAFYPSKLEPWSRYLSGEPGKAPVPYYDPLEFWIEETHKRGMEFHAWCNPYRVSQNASEPLAGNHIAFEHPDWIINYGNKLYYDPGHPEVRKFVTAVISDLVTRYDVDAIHFDDYFYPYRIAGKEFPDDDSFSKYNAENFADRADWRRHNVDAIIQMLSQSIKSAKPWVKFGISPFGVWRNKKSDPRGSDTNAGQTNYDDLYADILKWQEQNWIDYVTPQLYWHMGHPAADFKTLCDWWDEHAYGKEVYIGQGAYRIDAKSKDEAWTKGGEIEKQIEYLRQKKNISGSTYFSSKSFDQQLFGLTENLRGNYYKYRAIVPPMSWIDNEAPAKPRLKQKSGKRIEWKNAKSSDEMNQAELTVVYLNKKGEKLNSEDGRFVFEIVSGNELRFVNQKGKKQVYEIRISSLDRNNNESELSNKKRIRL